MALLVEQGKADFDDKIIDLLPLNLIEKIMTPSTKHLIKEITIKMLLSHTSGLSVHAFPGYVRDVPTHCDVLAGQSGINTMHVHLDGIPGQRFSYSGGGMTVLQLVLEHLTQLPFATLIQDLIFKPLKMHRSCYSIPQKENNVARAHYTGYTPCEDAYRTNPEQAAAGLWTTPTDLLKLVRALQSSLRNNDEPTFLRQDIARLMLTEIESTMALSWFAPRDPGIAFGHGGSNEPGWRCILIGYAELQFLGAQKKREEWPELYSGSGIAVMTNSAAGTDVCWKVLNAIAYIKGWSEIPLMYGNPVTTIPFPVRGLPLDTRWEEWIGEWSGGWRIGKTGNGEAIAVYRSLPPIKLLAAAMPLAKCADNVSVDVLLEGLEIMMRLSIDNDGKLVQIWDGGNGKITVVRSIQ